MKENWAPYSFKLFGIISTFIDARNSEIFLNPQHGINKEMGALGLAAIEVLGFSRKELGSTQLKLISCLLWLCVSDSVCVLRAICRPHSVVLCPPWDLSQGPGVVWGPQTVTVLCHKDPGNRMESTWNCTQMDKQTCRNTIHTYIHTYIPSIHT